MKAPRPLVVGLGHPLRRDDAVGLRLVEELASTGCARDVDLVACRSGLLDILHLLDGRPVVTVLDAVDCGLPPGAVVRRVRAGADLAGLFGPEETGSHRPNLGLSLAVLREAGWCIPWVVLYGIQPGDVGQGDMLSEAAERARRFLVRRLAFDRPWFNAPVLHDAEWLDGRQHMHGFGWVKEALARIEAVAAEQSISRVSAIYVRIGDLSGHSRDELAFAFECLRDGTVCHDASLVFESGPGLDVELVRLEGR